MKSIKRLLSLVSIVLALCMVLGGCSALDKLTGRNGGDVGAAEQGGDDRDLSAGGYASIEGIPDYAGEPYAVLNDNAPLFTSEEITTQSFERYADLDSLGRCGVTFACVGKDIMPTEERESISSVYPTGWEQNKYDASLVEGGWLYNRCHLIGFQLTGENANEKNLISGTRYLNIEGMLPFENMVADYVKETGNHVMYRVTPMFAGDNLLPSGVRMEGLSVEDDGSEIRFHIFAYNVQPGITIDYATGDNWLNGDEAAKMQDTEDTQATADGGQQTYILNTKSKKIHLPTCSGAADIHAENREETTKSKGALLKEGYGVCGICKP